jgi:hypothetical protein
MKNNIIMKKRHGYLFILPFFALFFACAQGNNRNSSQDEITCIPELNLRSYFSPGDYELQKIIRYQPKENLSSVLDSMIRETCKEVKNKPIILAFSLSQMNDSLIQIEAIEMHTFLAYKKEAVFYYDGYLFNYRGDYQEEIVEYQDSIWLWTLKSEFLNHYGSTQRPELHFWVYKYENGILRFLTKGQPE